MTLTLQIIRDHSPCIKGWKTLTKAIGSDLATELSIGDVLITNGLDDALWCLQCLEPRVRVAAIMPAVKRASVYTKDHRVHDCISAIEKWLSGDETVDLRAAAEAARAAKAAAEAARAAKAAAQAVRAAAQAAQAAWAAAWVAQAAQAAWAAWVAQAARAAQAAWAAWVAQAAWAAWAARAAERKLQEADLLAMFPPMILKGHDDE